MPRPSVAAVLDDQSETGLVRYTGDRSWTNLAAEGVGSLEMAVWRGPGDLWKAGAELLYRRGGRELTFERVEDQRGLGR